MPSATLVARCAFAMILASTWPTGLLRAQYTLTRSIDLTSIENRVLTGNGAVFVYAWERPDGQVRAYSPSTGQLLWQSTLEHGSNLIVEVALADLEQDGIDEVIAIVNSAYFGGNEKLFIFRKDHHSSSYALTATITLDMIENRILLGDGAVIVYSWGRPGAQLRAYDPVSGSLLWQSSLQHGDNILLDAVLDDFDGDGRDEIAAVVNSALFNGSERLFVFEKSGSSSSYEQTRSIALESIDNRVEFGDGTLFVYPWEHSGGEIRAFDPALGRLLWQSSLQHGSNLIVDLELADLDSDGRKEVIATVNDAFFGGTERLFVFEKAGPSDSYVRSASIVLPLIENRIVTANGVVFAYPWERSGGEIRAYDPVTGNATWESRLQHGSNLIVDAAAYDMDGDGARELFVIANNSYFGGREKLFVFKPDVVVVPNRAPVAYDTTATMQEDEAVTITLTGSDPEGVALQFSIASGPAFGSLSAITPVDGTKATVEYRPSANFFGTDSFRFSVSDGTSSATGMAVLSVAAVDDPPVVRPDAYQVEEDGVLDVGAPTGLLANDFDVEGVALVATTATSPTHGALHLNPDGSFVYTPAANFAGTDTFTYRASDASGSATTTVTLGVVAVDDAPSAAALTSPAAGTTIVIGGGAGQEPVPGDHVLIRIRWTASMDPEGQQVSYLYQLATDAGFSNVVYERSSGTADGFDLTVAETAAIFDAFAGAIALGTPVTVYHRIVATAGDQAQAGESIPLQLSRGTIVGTDDAVELPEAFAVQGIYPNPLRSSATINLDLPTAAEVRVDVFDLVGRKILVLPPRHLQPGRQVRLPVDASALVSGTYVYRVLAVTKQETAVGTGTMVLLK